EGRRVPRSGGHPRRRGPRSQGAGPQRRGGAPDGQRHLRHGPALRAGDDARHEAGDHPRARGRRRGRGGRPERAQPPARRSRGDRVDDRLRVLLLLPRGLLRAVRHHRAQGRHRVLRRPRGGRGLRRDAGRVRAGAVRERRLREAARRRHRRPGDNALGHLPDRVLRGEAGRGGGRRHRRRARRRPGRRVLGHQRVPPGRRPRHLRRPPRRSARHGPRAGRRARQLRRGGPDRRHPRADGRHRARPGDRRGRRRRGARARRPRRRPHRHPGRPVRGRGRADRAGAHRRRPVLARRGCGAHHGAPVGGALRRQGGNDRDHRGLSPDGAGLPDRRGDEQEPLDPRRQLQPPPLHPRAHRSRGQRRGGARPGPHPAARHRLGRRGLRGVRRAPHGMDEGGAHAGL
ncbi:MAG: Threonine dehydrogenase and related Zn-dependent dehydrogenases, partial [uncultured Solirubrobacteraceae bacterium]